MDFTVWLDSYGYLVLFIALMLELIIFGIPTEIIMIYVGFLVFQGKMGWIPSILFAAIGTCMGIVRAVRATVAGFNSQTVPPKKQNSFT